MFKQWLRCIPFISLIISSACVSATLELDLADGVSEMKMPLELEEDVQVHIINLAPGKLDKYGFSIVYKERDVPKLNLPSGLASKIANLGMTAGIVPGNAECVNLKKSFADLLATKKESDVKRLIDSLNDDLSKFKANPGGGCLVSGAATVSDITEVVNVLIASTEHTLTLKIRPQLGAILTVTDGEKSGLKKALYVNTEKRSRWITSYGFGFYDNKSDGFYSKSVQEEVTNADGSTTTSDYYIIAKQADRNRGSYTAQIVFTYPFESIQFGGIGLGVSGGLGATQDNIQAMFGLSAIIGENIVLTAGVSVQEFEVLKGQYEVDQNIGGEPIDSTALTNKTFKETGMIALTYRY